MFQGGIDIVAYKSDVRVEFLFEKVLFTIASAQFLLRTDICPSTHGELILKPKTPMARRRFAEP